jgi:hypothetical protein
MVTGIVIAQ